MPRRAGDQDGDTVVAVRPPPVTRHSCEPVPEVPAGEPVSWAQAVELLLAVDEEQVLQPAHVDGGRPISRPRYWGRRLLRWLKRSLTH